jgi:hypothetical protein
MSERYQFTIHFTEPDDDRVFIREVVIDSKSIRHAILSVDRHFKSNNKTIVEIIDRPGRSDWDCYEIQCIFTQGI